MKLIAFAILGAAFAAAQPQTYPFQDPNLPAEQRVNNIVSLMTLDEKIACLGTNPSVPRLGIKATGHSEGLHGLALGGPGGWGRRSIAARRVFHPCTWIRVRLLCASATSYSFGCPIMS